MYPPIVCLCGRSLGELIPLFYALRRQKTNADGVVEPLGDVLDGLKLTQQCCRARILTCVEMKELL